LNAIKLHLQQLINRHWIQEILAVRLPLYAVAEWTWYDLIENNTNENNGVLVNMATVRHAPSEPLHSPIRMAEVLAAFSFATDLGTGKSMGHAIRACYLGMTMARELRLSTAEQAELYYSFLLMHSGCTSLSLTLAPVIHGDELAAIADITLRDDANLLEVLNWLRRNVSPEEPLPTRTLNLIRALLNGHDAVDARGVCEVAVRVAQRLGMPQGVQNGVLHYLERWDGKGPFGLRENAIPLNARLLQMALKIEACHTATGPHEAEAMAHEQKGRSFDPQVVDVFLSVARKSTLWETLAQQDIWEIVLDLEPDSPHRYMDEAKLDDVALAAADFVDLKSPFTVGHSRETAGFAEGIARRMDLPRSEITDIRRAALVHDLGHVALPGHILFPQSQLSDVDKEKLRLHPYYTERILSRVPALASVAAIAGMHHERLNGTGYYRGLSGNELPASACILALADDFQDRLQTSPNRLDLDPKDVLKAMQSDVGPLFSPECFAALAQELGGAAPKPPRRREWPAGLTDREVEVLRHVAKGASNRQMAQELVVSEKTVAHHLEHIYDKIGISSRAAAVFFAMEHELIR
jgi:HD-GYP domain-containing protein (c-di-GMP phosphodiesterase class II)